MNVDTKTLVLRAARPTLSSRGLVQFDKVGYQTSLIRDIL